MLTPIQQIAAIFSDLSDDQKTKAVGHYSTVAATTVDNVTHLQSFFDPNVTSLTGKFMTRYQVLPHDGSWCHCNHDFEAASHQFNVW
jgi:hypothetical protein